MYGPVVSDHARHPRNRGTLEAHDASAEATNPLCGDRVTLELALSNGRIDAIRFRGEGCMIALAAASVLTELATGMTVADAAALPDERLVSALQTELRPSRVGCATLSLVALRDALGHWRGEASF